jgi:hypothetical protein
MVETYLEAKQSILALIVQSNNRARMNELEKLLVRAELTDNMIDPISLKKDLKYAINQLQTILNKGGK